MADIRTVGDLRRALESVPDDRELRLSDNESVYWLMAVDVAFNDDVVVIFGGANMERRNAPTSAETTPRD